MSLRQQLQAIYDEHGRLDAEIVVDAARPKDAPLHSHFEWNNSVAGEAYRKVQARELIRSVKVVYRNDLTGEKGSVRAFQSVRRSDAAAPSYEPVDKVLDDPITTQLLLRDMQRDIEALKQRYGHFVEFRKMVKQILESDVA